MIKPFGALTPVPEDPGGALADPGDPGEEVEVEEAGLGLEEASGLGLGDETGLGLGLREETGLGLGDEIGPGEGLGLASGLGLPEDMREVVIV